MLNRYFYNHVTPTCFFKASVDVAVGLVQSIELSPDSSDLSPLHYYFLERAETTTVHKPERIIAVSQSVK